jgi:hypothetical protein
METVFVSHSRGALQKRPLEHNKRRNKQEQGQSEAFVQGKKISARPLSVRAHVASFNFLNTLI